MNKLVKIRELVDAATAGEWVVNNNGFSSVINENTFSVIDTQYEPELITREKNSLDNCEFIAISRTLVPKLLDIIEAQSEALEHYASGDHKAPQRLWIL